MCSLLLTGTSAATNADDSSSQERIAYLLARALSYDDNLNQRVGHMLTIAVLYRADRAESEAHARSMVHAFAAFAGPKIQGIPVRTHALPFDDPTSLRQSIKKQAIGALFVTDDLEEEMPAIAEISREHKVVTLTCREHLVRRGVALGVVPGSSKGVLVVNLPASRLQGASFAPDLLRVARVLR